MPQVYLPQNYAVVQHDGTISGQNVTLTASNGGTITNTGSITATDTLTVNAGSLTNQQRSTDIGTQSTFIPDLYTLITTTGTVAQQGGFMSAGNYQLNVDAVDQIGGALQKLNADGTVNTAGTQQQLAALKAQLGNSFTQSTVQNDLHTSVTSLAESEGAFQTIGMLAVMVVASVITAGAASAAIGSGATVGSTFAAGTAATTTAEGVAMPAVSAGLGNIALSAGVAGMTSSALGQAANGTFSMSAMFQAGATAMLTAGLTNGITVSDGSLGWTWTASPNSLASLAGVQSVGGALVPQAGSVTASTVLTQGAAIAAEATVQAGVQTAIGGGSFLTNLRNSAVSDVAAAGAYAIGNASLTSGSLVAAGTPGYWLAHAALGCAASAAEGTGCAGGAIGGAASAALSPDFIKGIDAAGVPLDVGQRAALAAFATLAGGGLAGVAGVNVNSAATAAQNEALNNSAQSDHIADTIKSAGLFGSLLLAAYTMAPWLPGNPIAQTAGSTASSLAQGLAGQVQSHNGPNPPSTGAAPVTICEGPLCSVVVAPGSPGGPSSALLSNGGDNGEGELQGSTGSPPNGQAPATDSGVPGRVQSRINLTNEGLDHIGDRHLDPTVNASQFTIGKSDLTDLLQRPSTVSTPVTRTIQSGGNISYVREVNVGQVVGTDKFNGYQPTSVMTVITDKYGNLVTAFPGKLK
jgi:hypothetical protein